MEIENRIKELEDELEKTRSELNETKERLKSYTAPKRSKKFYELHKDEIKQKAKDYRIKTNYTVPKEKKQEYNRVAYLNRKAKQEASTVELADGAPI
jgi:hypothetical protein